MENDVGSSGPVQFFSVSYKKLVILSVSTFGLYDIYWFYKNWEAIKESDKSDIWPVARAIFAVFFSPSIFRRILKDAEKLHYKSKYTADTLAAVYIILIILGNFSNKGDNVIFSIMWLASFFSVIPLLAIQHAVNFNNLKADSSYKPSNHFSVLEILLVIVGGFFVIGTAFVINWNVV